MRFVVPAGFRCAFGSMNRQSRLPSASPPPFAKREMSPERETISVGTRFRL